MYITPKEPDGSPYSVEITKDDAPQAEGVHEGLDGSSVLVTRDIGSFISPGVVCYNITQGTNGLVTEAEGTEITVDGVTWNKNDQYEIYFTNKKGTVLSKYLVDKISGKRVGWYYLGEIDLPGDEFGPNQPETV